MKNTTTFSALTPLLGRLLYSPQRFCGFSGRGELRIEEMLRQAPLYHFQFNKSISLERQMFILQQSFLATKASWLSNKVTLDNQTPIFTELQDLEEQDQLKKGKRLSKSFFEKSWHWTCMVPLSYKRTLAPRITTSGGTMHAMKKEMSREVLKVASQGIHNSCFIDIDLSACHAHIAASLQNQPNSLLILAVTQAKRFWNDLADLYTKKCQATNIDLDVSSVRSILKVCFYTSLNGGNPFNVNRLASNLKINAPDLLLPYPSVLEFESSSTFSKLNHLLSDLHIIAEVKELNKSCVYQGLTYTLDRQVPYPINS